MSDFICERCGANHIDTGRGYISYCDCSDKPRKGNLFLILKSEWFDKIKSGEKTSEYREVKPYWDIRLRKNFATVTFAKGYRKDREITQFEIKSIGITTQPNDLNLPKVYEVKLGRRML